MGAVMLLWTQFAVTLLIIWVSRLSKMQVYILDFVLVFDFDITDAIVETSGSRFLLDGRLLVTASISFLIGCSDCQYLPDLVLTICIRGFAILESFLVYYHTLFRRSFLY